MKVNAMNALEYFLAKEQYDILEKQRGVEVFCDNMFVLRYILDRNGVKLERIGDDKLLLSFIYWFNYGRIMGKREVRAYKAERAERANKNQFENNTSSRKE